MSKDVDRQSQQERTFLNFVNYSLSKYGRSITNLSDLSTGVELFFVLRSINERIGREFPIFDKLEKKRTDLLVVQKVNVNTILEFLQDVENINLVGINASLVCSKDMKVIMGLLWQIISHYLGKEEQQVSEDDEEVERSKDGKNQKTISSFYSVMVSFINEFSEESSHKIRKLTDWKTGKALFNLVKTIISKKEQTKERNEFLEKNRSTEGPELIRNCIDFATEDFSIPRLLTEREFTNPDEMSLAIYLTYFKDYSREQLLKESSSPLEERGGETDEVTTFDDEKKKEEEEDERIKRMKELLLEKEEIIQKLQLEKVSTEKQTEKKLLNLKNEKENLKNQIKKLLLLLKKEKDAKLNDDHDDFFPQKHHSKIVSVSSAPFSRSNVLKKVVVKKKVEVKKHVNSSDKSESDCVLSRPITIRENEKKSWLGMFFAC